MSKNQSGTIEFNLHLQFLLKDCYELISETIDEDIDLYTWNVGERQGMLNAIDDAMAIMKENLPKFVIKKERHLKVVPKN